MGDRPYYVDERVTLYHADARELMPSIAADVVIADPPYGETSLAWDQWPEAWLSAIRSTSTQLWCFGSLRLFMQRHAEFVAAGWKLAQEIVWEKHNGSNFHADRFRKVHELVGHFYRGSWTDVPRAIQTTPDAVRKAIRRKRRPPHFNEIVDPGQYESQDGGPRLMRSVIRVRSTHGYAVHPTQKPVGILSPLIAYSCPPGGGPPRSVRGQRLHADRSEGSRRPGHRHRDRRTLLRGRRRTAGRPGLGSR